MRYEELVPSLDICKKLAETGICQDEPELWYGAEIREDDKSSRYIWHIYDYGSDHDECVVAPTLPQLLKELPICNIKCLGNKIIVHICEGVGHMTLKEIIIEDENICDAIALALLKIKEEK